MKSETNWIIGGLALAMLVLSVLSFIRVPAYEKGAWFVISSFATALGTVMGYKFGRSLPQQANQNGNGGVQLPEPPKS